MGKKKRGVSQVLSRFRGWIQAGAALLTNLHLLAGLGEKNFLKVVVLLHIVCSFSLLADDVPSAPGLIVSQER